MGLVLTGTLACAGEHAEIMPAALATMGTDGESYRFTHVRDNAPTEDIRRQVVRYEVDGLRQYALVLWPAAAKPENGWPVLQFNHGYHPDPPRNGFNARGESDRPGDYYRETVQAFARSGFVVVTPDYRGHNISQGEEFTSRPGPDTWYSRDAIACFLALESLPNLDLSRAYMLGHSMGGAVTLRVLQALGSRVRAASIWSVSVGDYDNDLLSPFFSLRDIPVPLSIQHSRGDAAVPVDNSLEVFDVLNTAGRDVTLKVYPGDDHLFTGQDFAEAVALDLSWYQRYR